MTCKIVMAYPDQIMLEVDSSNKNQTPYTVNFDRDGCFCNCPDYLFRKVHENGKCKHIKEAEELIRENNVDVDLDYLKR